ncbi:MAG: hypothetical protein AAF614_41030 [Chloroflexota bacterium]
MFDNIPTDFELPNNLEEILGRRLITEELGYIINVKGRSLKLKKTFPSAFEILQASINGEEQPVPHIDRTVSVRELDFNLAFGNFAKTTNTGKVNFRIAQYFSTAAGSEVDVISFTATPMSDRPVFLTITIENNRSSSPIVVVHSWHPNGNPAPEIPFSWQACVDVGGIVEL